MFLKEKVGGLESKDRVQLDKGPLHPLVSLLYPQHPGISPIPTPQETGGFLFGEVRSQGKLELSNTLHSLGTVGGADCGTDNWEFRNIKLLVPITEDYSVDKLTCKEKSLKDTDG